MWGFLAALARALDLPGVRGRNARATAGETPALRLHTGRVLQ